MRSARSGESGQVRSVSLTSQANLVRWGQAGQASLPKATLPLSWSPPALLYRALSKLLLMPVLAGCWRSRNTTTTTMAATAAMIPSTPSTMPAMAPLVRSPPPPPPPPGAGTRALRHIFFFFIEWWREREREREREGERGPHHHHLHHLVQWHERYVIFFLFDCMMKREREMERERERERGPHHHHLHHLVQGHGRYVIFFRFDLMKRERERERERERKIPTTTTWCRDTGVTSHFFFLIEWWREREREREGGGGGGWGGGEEKSIFSVSALWYIRAREWPCVLPALLRPSYCADSLLWGPAFSLLVRGSGLRGAYRPSNEHEDGRPVALKTAWLTRNRLSSSTPEMTLQPPLWICEQCTAAPQGPTKVAKNKKMDSSLFVCLLVV